MIEKVMMQVDPWLLLLFLLAIIYFLFLYSSSRRSKPAAKKLPPGPIHIPVLTIILYLTKNLFDIEPVLRRLRAKHGPIVTLRITSKPTIFISDHSLAHKALVHHGSVSSDRLPTTELNRILSSDRHNVSSAPYGPLWRALRRNLSSGILNPARVKDFSWPRRRVLDALVDELRQHGDEDGVVVVMESFRFAMFCLLVLMCFGEKLGVEKIREIEATQTFLHRSFMKFNVFSIFPTITKLVFRKRWNTLLEIRQRQEEIFLPLIRSRRSNDNNKVPVCSYTDYLLELSIPEQGGRRLTENEIVSLCSEFLSAGTDTTATALEWIMAELVKHEEIQKKLVAEIEKEAPLGEEIKEEDLVRMPYLKAVVLEGLRRHPPAHFVVPHVVTEDIDIGGYTVPTNASVNFMVAEMGWDGKVWDEPMEFKPERFLVGGEGEGVDITGSREIKMMPFGAGRRICPGLGLAMLHLEYFVANLVREFEWLPVEGEQVDLSEKLELTMVMKNQLRAKIVPRREKSNQGNVL